MKRLLLAALLLLASAAAHPESAAPELREDVVEVAHEPSVPPPGTQWTGSITFRSGHDVERVQYQICRVGQECFAQPTFAERHDDTFTFDTSRYTDPPVAWGIGDGSDWHIGYKFILHTSNGTLAKFPEGLSVQSDACREMGIFACDATNYFVFTIPGAEAQRQAPLPLAATIGALAAAGVARTSAHWAAPRAGTRGIEDDAVSAVPGSGSRGARIGRLRSSGRDGGTGRFRPGGRDGQVVLLRPDDGDGEAGLLRPDDGDGEAGLLRSGDRGGEGGLLRPDDGDGEACLLRSGDRFGAAPPDVEGEGARAGGTG